MKHFKRVLFFFIAAMIVSGFSGCYVVKGGNVKDVVGTYKLTTYSRTYDSTNSAHAGEKIDYIEQKGITAYLIVTESGEGYYIYKDNETPLYCEAV